MNSNARDFTNSKIPEIANAISKQKSNTHPLVVGNDSKANPKTFTRVDPSSAAPSGLLRVEKLRQGNPGLPLPIEKVPSLSGSEVSASDSDDSGSTLDVEKKNEKHYRRHFQKKESDMLPLVLYEPSQVDVLDVGYCSEGRFITLFNARHPKYSSIQALMPIKEEVTRSPNKVLKIVKDIYSFFSTTADSMTKPDPIPLKSGQVTVYVRTEMTEHRSIVSSDNATEWLRSNNKKITELYSDTHKIKKDDLILVSGTLKASNYAILVSNAHSEGHASFSAFCHPLPGLPWGSFNFGTDIPKGPGPSNEPDESMTQLPISSKVSIHGEAWCAISLAGIQFKEDHVH